MKGLHIVSTGRYLPKMVVSNEKVGENAGIDDEWIVKRTGIHERRFCDVEFAGTVSGWVVASYLGPGRELAGTTV